jgi:hypothetical protein
MNYVVNHSAIRYDAKGPRAFGETKVLLNEAIDLTDNLPWSSEGFCIAKLFPDQLYLAFIQETRLLLSSCWRKAGLVISNDFEFENYHKEVTTLEKHLQLLEKTKVLPTIRFPVDIKLIEQRISEICQVNLEVRNPFDNQSVFHFRVIRPNSGDNNPLHRDVWLEDYKDCINLYLPFAGSTELSSLIILPGSHHWPESKVERTIGGAEINNVKFNVPAVTSIAGAYEILRPNPEPNQVLVFSPYLVHGGAVNLNADKTRISLEIRLWKK